MNEKEIKDKLRIFLSRSFSNYLLKDEDNFVEMGIVHSLFIIQIIMFIEKNFKVELEDEDIDLEKLKTINDLYSIVSQKMVNVVDN